MLKIDRLELGPVQTNCYIVSDKERNCIIFDPGEEAGKVQALIKQKQLTPLAILLTHAHFDHIGAVDELRDLYDIPVYLHEKERDFLASPNLNGSGKYAMIPDCRVKEADKWITRDEPLEIGPFHMELRHVPGHSPGSVMFYFHDDRFAIVGDTLFSGSIGRTDLADGSEELLLSSIRRALLTLPDDTFLFPGHGPDTTPLREKQHNPFLRT